MSAKRDAVIAAIQELERAGRRLATTIQESHAALHESLALLDRGTSLADTLEFMGTAERRLRMTVEMSEFEEARHRLRLAVTDAGLEEGMTIAAVGRAFGVSRQLAAKFAKELRDGGEPVGA
jgi:dihydroxyacetone kinase DhaKLM complex PTS-EIIA-like component DhaM